MLPHLLTLSTAWPDRAWTTHGVFVEQRARWMREQFQVSVVAPVGIRRAWKREAREALPSVEARPVFWYVPGILKRFDSRFLAASVRPALRRVHDERPIDWIDAHFSWPEGAAAAQLARELDVPFSITLHGTLGWLWEDRPRRERMGAALRQASAVFAVSRELRSRALELGVAPERLELLPNGYNPDCFHLPDGAPSPASPLVVAVGHLSERKGFQHLISAWPRVLQAHPAARLVIVGAGGAEGDCERALRSQVLRLGLGDSVQMPGNLPQREVGNLLRQASCFALPSAFEGCPLVVVEALACGVPIVATDVGEVPALVGSGQGLLIPTPVRAERLADAVDEVLQRDWPARRVAAAVQDLDWRSISMRAGARILEALNREPLRPLREIEHRHSA